MRELGPKNGFFINQSIKKKKEFWALTPSFLRFRQNKKKLEHLNHFEKLLLHTFCPRLFSFFPSLQELQRFRKKNQFDPLKLSATRIFWWVIFIGVLSHITEKKIENRRGYTSIFFSCTRSTCFNPCVTLISYSFNSTKIGDYKKSILLKRPIPTARGEY